MEYQINDKVKYLNGMLCEIDNMYQTILMKKNLSDSEYVVLFSILELGEGCLQKIPSGYKLTKRGETAQHGNRDTRLFPQPNWSNKPGCGDLHEQAV